MRDELLNKGQRMTPIHLGIFLIIGSIFMIVLSSMYNKHINEINKIGVETTGQLVRFIPLQDEPEMKYVPEFKYVIDGVEYFIESKYSTDEELYKGNGLGYIERIKYNPEKPEQSVIIGEEPDSANIIIFIAIGVLILGGLTIVIYIKKI